MQAYYDARSSTKVTEMSNFMKYESQHFRCKVQLGLQEGIADKCWSVGLIQACDKMLLENRYGPYGSSYWEFHPLKSGRHSMVNDSDGRQYPFYSLTTSKLEVHRSVVGNTLSNLYYEDHFYPTVAWELPYNSRAKLTDVIRKQDFWVWLVAIKRASANPSDQEPINPKTDDIHILKSVRWRYNLHMQFDPQQPIGKRLTGVYDTQEEQPYILDGCKPISLSALSPPHCNAAQSLIWYPTDQNERPRLLVAPKQTIVPWDIWTMEMAPGKKMPSKNPEHFRIVGEWKYDREIGILTNKSVGARANSKGRTSRNIFDRLTGFERP
ncbi:Protein fam78a [Cichlidogyrus casuarinus]|uniref:Protein fam78a n=1 Tax=Cichlidogyrus casuarinus TaxID=1844966 RepID=A0ABD2QNI7_9PLAT